MVNIYRVQIQLRDLNAFDLLWTPLLDAVSSPLLSFFYPHQVKYFAERALKHLCEGTTAAEAASGVLPGQSAALTQYLQAATSGGSTVSAAEREAAMAVRDYMRRVMPTLPAESDSEGYD